jgi:hypothetical protein
MVSISNVDLVMAALRARLQRLSKDRRTTRASGTAAAGRKADRSEAGEIGNLQQLPPREFDRALVGLLLERELGEGLGSDPRFKALIERTSAILEDDPEIQALFREVQRQAQ